MRPQYLILATISPLMLVSGDGESPFNTLREFQLPAFHMATEDMAWDHLSRHSSYSPHDQLELHKYYEQKRKVLARATLNERGLLVVEKCENTTIAIQRQSRLFVINEVTKQAHIDANRKDLVVLLHSDPEVVGKQSSCLEALVVANAYWPTTSPQFLASLALRLPTQPCQSVSFVVTKVHAEQQPIDSEEVQMIQGIQYYVDTLERLLAKPRQS